MAIFVTIHNDAEDHHIQLTSKPFIIGRSSSCDLKIKDELISGKHAALQLNQDKKAVVKDLDSTNGSLINGIKIHESYISLDDELTIGNTLIKLDPEQMSEKERQVHTKMTSAGKTQMKFVNLHGGKESSEKRGIQAMKEFRQKSQNSEFPEENDPAKEQGEEIDDSPAIKVDFDETDDDYLVPPSTPEEDENNQKNNEEAVEEQVSAPEEFRPEASGYDPLSDMDDAEPTKLSDVRPSPVNNNQEESNPESGPKKERESLQQRARKLSQSADGPQQKNNPYFKEIDAEKSTGNTRMIQVEKKTNTAKKKKPKKKKKKKLSPFEKLINTIKNLIPGG